MIPAVGYARDSGGDEQERSVDQQIAIYQDHAAKASLNLIRVFSDRARTGSTTVGRDGFEQLIDYLRAAKEPHTLLLWKHNRFARNIGESQYYKAYLRRLGHTLVFIADNIPQDEEIAGIFEALLEWKAARDLKDISTDAKRGLAALVTTKRSDGAFEGFAPGTPPTCFIRQPVQIGLKRNGAPRLVSRWAPDPATWSRGQLAWQLRAAGQSLKQIHKTTKLYKTLNSYSTFFANEIYLGTFHFGEHVLQNFVPALCTQEQWDAVQRLRRNHTNERHPRRIASTYLLSGKMYCAHCGSRMNGANGAKGWRYYICSRKALDTTTCPSTRISAAAVEHSIIEFIGQHILTEDALTALYAGWYNDLVNASRIFTNRADELRLKVKELQTAITHLLNLVEQGQGGPAAGERLAQRQTELANHQNILADIQRQQAAIVELPPPTAEALQQFRLTALAKLHSDDPQQIKPILQAFIVHIDAKKESGTVTYTVPLSLTAFSCSIACAPTHPPPIQQQIILWQKPRSMRSPFQQRNARIISLRQQGATLREIAQQSGLTTARIDEICAPHIPRRFPGRRSRR